MAEQNRPAFLRDDEAENLKAVKAALKEGRKDQAREILTRAIKEDRNNPTYWVWMSAAVEKQKEQVACLRQALKLDPENKAARTGLVFLGELEPDPQPARLFMPRVPLWKAAVEKQVAEKEKLAGLREPVGRILKTLAIAGAGLILLVAGGMVMRARSFVVSPTATRRPPVTLTFTPSSTPLFRTATPTFMGATPLVHFLVETYTSTPLYVLTQHPVLTRASFEAGLRSLALGNLETARIQFQDVLKNEPDAVDVHYFLGESYRLEEDCPRAMLAYQQAVETDPGFAPAHLGRALCEQAGGKTADAKKDFNNAIRLDPNYAEAYLARGAFLLSSDPAAAKQDLLEAVSLAPGSALAYLHLAEAEMALGDFAAAQEAALQANRLDSTLIPVYLRLGQSSIEVGEISLAKAALRTYSIYASGAQAAYLELGSALNEVAEYEEALVALNKALDGDERNEEAYYQRGLALLNLGKAALAEADFKMAILLDEADFDAQLGLARAFFEQGMPGDAYIQAEQKALPLARSDESKAQAYYWEAVFLQALGDAQSRQGAENYWSKLLSLPENAMPSAWREQAYEALQVTPTSAKSATPSPTKTSSPTASRTSTPTFTKTAPPTASPTFTRTGTATPTRSVTPATQAAPSPTPSIPSQTFTRTP